MYDSLIGDSHRSTNAQGAGNGFSLDQLLTGPGGLATGAAAGGLAAMLMGGAKPKKLAKNALKVGGVALVGGLAYKAWRDWQAKKTSAPGVAAETSAPAPVGSAFLPDIEHERHSLARALARAMISAAKADGHVTDNERKRILGELQKLNISEEDHAFIREELDRPVDVEAIVRDAKTPAIAAELYTASLLAIDPEGDAERGYLAMLAARLKLDPDLVTHIHANTLDQPAQAAA